MAEFKELIKCLCTEEMIDTVCKDVAPRVRVGLSEGYLVGYDMGLGFTFIPDYGNPQYELTCDEIDIVKSTG